MATINNLWLPQADSTNATPAQFDMNKVVNSDIVEASRIDRLFVSRMVENRASTFMQNGNLNRSVDFTIVGGMGVEKHGLNDRHVGSDMAQIQRNVNLDDRPFKVVHDTETITRIFNQVETESAVLPAMGYALAEFTEVEVMKAICDASAYAAAGSEDTSEFLVGGGTGTAITTTTGQARALLILDNIEDAGIAFAKKGVPVQGRHCVVTPEDWWEIAKVEKVTTAAATSIAGGIYGNMDLTGGKIDFTGHLDENMPLVYRGFLIWQSNLIDATFNPHVQGLQGTHVIDADFNSRGSTYHATGNFTTVEGLIFQSSCVGLIDIMNAHFKEEEIQSSTNIQRSAMSWIGLDTFHPEAAITLVNA